MSTRCLLLLISSLLLALAASTSYAQTSWFWYSGNPMISGDVGDPCVLYDSSTQIYSMWYVDLQLAAVRKAISTDGVNWFVGNGIALAPGEVGAYDHLIYSVCVISHMGQYSMYYTASRAGDTLIVARAISQDGVSWEKNPNSPVLRPGAPGSWDCRHVSGPEVSFAKGRFMMWYSGSDLSYLATGLATSEDGITWVKSVMNPLLPHGGPGLPDSKQAAVVGVTWRDDQYFLIYRGMDELDIESYCLAMSADGEQWSKYYRNPVIPRGVVWDSWQLGKGSLLWLNGRFNLWYCGTPGSFWAIGLAISYPGSLSAGEEILFSPRQFQLLQNYPNPFNPTTVISYQLPAVSDVTLRVYDVFGREVATLVEGRESVGIHAVEFKAENLASGIYFCRLAAGRFVDTKRMILLK